MLSRNQHLVVQHSYLSFCFRSAFPLPIVFKTLFFGHNSTRGSVSKKDFGPRSISQKGWFFVTAQVLGMVAVVWCSTLPECSGKRLPRLAILFYIIVLNQLFNLTPFRGQPFPFMKERLI